MKIAQIVCVFPPYKGGIGQVALKYSELLAERGHSVTVFTPKYENDENYEETHTFNICRLKPALKLGKGAFLPQLIYKLGDFDIVHLHFPFFGGVEPVYFSKFFSSKQKLFIHYHMDILNLPLKAKVLSLPSSLLKNILFKQAVGVTCASFDYILHSDIKKIYSIHQNKFCEIPFGVDLNFFKPGNNYLNNKNILFVGGLDKAHNFKGVDILIKAFSKISSNSWMLNIVGSGDLFDYYKKIAKDSEAGSRISFLGKLSDKQLASQYQNSEMLILPSVSKHEAFGLVLLEAMASGIPVIASDLPGVRSVFENNKQGLTFKTGSDDDLRNKIQMLISNNDLRKEMGLAARKLAEEKYDWQLIGKKLEDFYLKKLHENLLNK